MGNARVGGDARRHRFKGRHGRELMTALGPVRLERSDACCAGVINPDFQRIGWWDSWASCRGVL